MTHSHKALSIMPSATLLQVSVITTFILHSGDDFTVVCIMELCYQHISHTFTPFLTSRYNVLIRPLEVGGGGLGKRIKVSHRGLFWSPRTLTFHVAPK